MNDPKTLEQIEGEKHERNLHDAWAALLSHEAGRLVLWSVLDCCGVSKTGAAMFPFMGDARDTLLRGRQQVGGELLDEFVHGMHAKRYIEMLNEADQRADDMANAIAADERAENEDET